MQNSQIIEKLEKNLFVQTSLIDSIYELQRSVYDLVLKRDWENAKKMMGEIDEFSEKFILAEKKLIAIMGESTFETQKNNNLENLIDSFLEPNRSKLKNIYKTLKEKVLLSKIENDVFNSYLEHAQILLKGVFELVSEDRSGQTYTRTGEKADSDLSNVLVDRVF